MRTAVPPSNGLGEDGHGAEEMKRSMRRNGSSCPVVPGANGIGWIAGLVLVLVAGTAGAQGRVPHGQAPAPEGFPGMLTPSIQALTITKDHTVFAGTFGMGVFRSVDRGATWEAAGPGVTDPFILSLHAMSDGTLYAGTFRRGVFRSRDRGVTWTSISGGLKRLEIKALMEAHGILYAGTGDGVYRLGEGDAQWTVVSKGLEDILVHSLAMASDRTLYAGTSGKGVQHYKAGASPGGWRRLARGLKDHEGLVENYIRVLAIDEKDGLYAGTFNGGVFRSTDRGATWTPISRALPNDSIRGIVADRGEVIVGTGRGVFKTVDQGRQWMPKSSGLTELSVQVLVSSQEGVLYAGTSAGVFRSDDRGDHWIRVSEGMVGTMEPPFRF